MAPNGRSCKPGSHFVPDRAATERNGETGFWRLVTRPETASLAVATPELLRRFGDLLSPAFAREALCVAEARAGRPLLAPEAAEKSLLYNRFLRHNQLRWVREIGQAGFDVVYLKGFAAAHTLYENPDARTVGDLDLLIREADLDRLIRFLAGRGFRFGGGARSPWGFISKTSFLPFVSADGSANLDLHIAPDAYPATLALSTEALFAESQKIEAAGLVLRVPSAEHGFFLLLTNAAKVAFGPLSVRKTVDAICLLRRVKTLDWDRLGRLAAKGRLAKPLRAYLALLRHLGAETAGVPDALMAPFRGLAAAELGRLLHRYDTLFAKAPGRFETLRTELLLGGELRVGLYRNWLRLRGLVRPYGGRPPEKGIGFWR